MAQRQNGQDHVGRENTKKKILWIGSGTINVN